MPRHPLDDPKTDARTAADGTAQAVYVALAVTPNGGEDIAAFYDQAIGGWMPLVVTDINPHLLASIKGAAIAVAFQSGRPIRVVKFSTREVIEEISL